MCRHLQQHVLATTANVMKFDSITRHCIFDARWLFDLVWMLDVSLDVLDLWSKKVHSFEQWFSIWIYFYIIVITYSPVIFSNIQCNINTFLFPYTGLKIIKILSIWLLASEIQSLNYFKSLSVFLLFLAYNMDSFISIRYAAYQK